MEKDKVNPSGEAVCKACRARFDPEARSADPAEEMGRFFSREHYGDEGELCQSCLASRGRLAMMYHREMD